MAKDPLKTLKNRAHQSKRTLLIAFLASHVCYLTCVNRTFTTCSEPCWQLVAPNDIAHDQIVRPVV